MPLILESQVHADLAHALQSPKYSPLVNVSTERTWETEGPLGLKLRPAKDGATVVYTTL